MNSNYYETESIQDDPLISVVYEFMERLYIEAEKSFSRKQVDVMSNTRITERPHKCAVSDCFDMGNICCKECKIKRCCYKCNFIDKKVCENQSI